MVGETASPVLSARELAAQLYALNRLLVKAIVQCELACERNAGLADPESRQQIAERDHSRTTGESR
jgi:hypothetical protein